MLVTLFAALALSAATAGTGARTGAGTGAGTGRVVTTGSDAHDLGSMLPANPFAYIPPQCYTKTVDAAGKVHNPCYTCHVASRAPNHAAAPELQLAYDFPAPARVNPWVNLFRDRREAIDAMADAETLDFVRSTWRWLTARSAAFEGDVPLERLRVGQAETVVAVAIGERQGDFSGALHCRCRTPRSVGELALDDRGDQPIGEEAWTSPLVSQNWTLHAVTLVLVMLASVLLSRRLTEPMRRFAEAAGEVGRGRRAVLPAGGPSEVRRTAEAFDAMQRRILALVEDRTHLLPAIGHDLRTPLTSARLRVHLVEEEPLRPRRQRRQARRRGRRAVGAPRRGGRGRDPGARSRRGYRAGARVGGLRAVPPARRRAPARDGRQPDSG